MKNEISKESYTRRNSLRLPGFDYSAQRAYFITIIARDREPVFTNKAFAREDIKILLELRQSMSFNLYAYCLMPNHFHAVIGCGNSGKSLSEICGSFKSITTRAFWNMKPASFGRDNFTIISSVMKKIFQKQFTT